MSSAPLPANAGSLVAALQSGDMTAADEFARSCHAWLSGEARHLSRDLADRDLVDDVVQETYEKLLENKVTLFDPARGRIETYLRLILRTAAGKVRAANAMPGWTVRRLRVRDEVPGVVDPHVYLDARTPEQREHVLLEADPIESVDSVFDEIVDAICIDAFRSTLPPKETWVAAVVEDVVHGATSLDQVRVPGRSRYAVRRRLRQTRPALVKCGLVRR